MSLSEPLITLRLQLSPVELASLLMAQITQAQHSRLTLGEGNSTTRVDRAVLEKLVAAQRSSLAVPSALTPPPWPASL